MGSYSNPEDAPAAVKSSYYADPSSKEVSIPYANTEIVITKVRSGNVSLALRDPESGALDTISVQDGAVYCIPTGNIMENEALADLITRAANRVLTKKAMSVQDASDFYNFFRQAEASIPGAGMLGKRDGSMQAKLELLRAAQVLAAGKPLPNGTYNPFYKTRATRDDVLLVEGFSIGLPDNSIFNLERVEKVSYILSGIDDKDGQQTLYVDGSGEFGIARTGGKVLLGSSKALATSFVNAIGRARKDESITPEEALEIKQGVKQLLDSAKADNKVDEDELKAAIDAFNKAVQIKEVPSSGGGSPRAKSRGRLG